MTDLLALMRKIQEAQAVRLGISVTRQFSDADLADSTKMLEEAEVELYGAPMKEAA